MRERIEGKIDKRCIYMGEIDVKTVLEMMHPDSSSIMVPKNEGIDSSRVTAAGATENNVFCDSKTWIAVGKRMDLCICGCI